MTVVATSYMASQAVIAATRLEAQGIDVEVIDLRSVKPWDESLVFESVARTGRLVIADAAWKTGGIAAEIAASVAGELLERLVAPIARVCLPDAPAPMSRLLVETYCIGARDVVAAVTDVVAHRGSSAPASADEHYPRTAP